MPRRKSIVQRKNKEASSIDILNLNFGEPQQMKSVAEYPSYEKEKPSMHRARSLPNAKAPFPGITLDQHRLFEDCGLLRVALLNSVFKEDIRDYKQDSVVISNSGKKKINFTINVPDDPRIEIFATPNTGTVNAGKSITVHFRIRVFCTTQLTNCIEILVSEAKKSKLLSFRSKQETTPPGSYFLNFKIKSEPSRYLDHNEIDIQGQSFATGAFGEIFRGRYRQQDVCVKVVPEICAKEELMALEQEVSVLEKVHSPFLVTYLGCTRIPGQPTCLVMQYEEAGSLADVMASEAYPNFSQRLKLKILLDAAKGVQHLHCNDVYHMDLKPANMVIASLEENATVNTKIIDFDLATITVDENYSRESKGTHFGSVPYSPPEALAGEAHYRAETYDTYSFGITMWEVLSGQPLYPNLKTRDIKSFVLAGKRPDITQVEFKFRPLIEACWHQNRKNRPNFVEIVSQLDKFIFDVPKTLKRISTTNLNSPNLRKSSENFSFIPPDDESQIGWVGTPNREQAEALLLYKNFPTGTFLFRWSGKNGGSYVMSYLKKMNGKDIVDHIAFIKPVGTGIVVDNQNHKMTHYASLTEYVQDMRSKKIISIPIPTTDEENSYTKSPK